MKYYAIDEDLKRELIDLLSSIVGLQQSGATNDNDLYYYTYLLDCIEDTDLIADVPTQITSEEKIRLSKVERYLRMMQEQLNYERYNNNPKNSLEQMLNRLGLTLPKNDDKN